MILQSHLWESRELCFLDINNVYSARNGPTPANLPAGLAGGDKWSELLPAGFHLCRSDCFRPLFAGFCEAGGSR